MSDLVPPFNYVTKATRCIACKENRATTTHGGRPVCETCRTKLEKWSKEMAQAVKP